MKENLHELPGLIDLAYEYGIREIHLQRLVYFEQGLAHSKQALFRRSTREELELVHRCEEICKQRGIVFSAAGSATPLESLVRDFGDRSWSGCQRPYTLTYITSSGNVLSCCFAAPIFRSKCVHAPTRQKFCCSCFNRRSLKAKRLFGLTPRPQSSLRPRLSQYR